MSGQQLLDFDFSFDYPEEKPGIDLDIVARIKQRRRQLIVHSFIYYRLSDNIVSDHKYDEWARELIDLQQKYPEEAKEAPYAKDFEGFQMGDSFKLPMGEPWVIDTVTKIMAYHKKRG